MARYRKIDTRMWSDSKFNKLSPIKPSGQSLFQYLLTARESTMLPGMMRMSEAGTAEFLGWSLRAFRKAWREIEAQNLARADWKRQFVFIPNALKYNEPQSPNVIKGWFQHWDELPECELKDESLKHIAQFVEGMSESFVSVFRKAFRKPLLKARLEASRNQEQEQKQKQSSPHSAAVDTSSDDATTDESAGDGGGVGFASEGISDQAEVLEAVESFETAPEPVSEPPPIEQPPPVEKTPQTQAQPPQRPEWKVGRDLAGLPGKEPLTTLDIDKALRARGYIRGAVSTHAWHKLGPVHESSPLTAEELREALQLAERPGIGAPLNYMAGCIVKRRHEDVTVSPVEYEHERRERIVSAWLGLQYDNGYKRDEDRACREAERGMPTQEDRERYARHGGSYSRMDEEYDRVSKQSLAMIMDSLAGRMSMSA